MTAGHVLMKVFASFIIDGIVRPASAGRRHPQHGDDGRDQRPRAAGRRIQAYVFALLTSLYLNDAVNLH
jgi:F-type H+-transporting ATPase subunit a